MRGILGVVLSACLLVGCGGVEADVDASPPSAAGPGAEESGDVSASVYLECEYLDGSACPADGASPRACKNPVGSSTCYCDDGYPYWRCYY